MKRLTALSTILTVVVVLAGCFGTTSGGTPTGRATALSAPSADHQVTIAAPSWAEETIRDPAPVVTQAGDTSLPWKFVSLSPDGRVIQLVWVAGDGSCTHLDGILVEETAATVTVTAGATTDWSQKACPAMAKVGAGTLTLSAPLGYRTLWHAPVSELWDVVARVLDGA